MATSRRHAAAEVIVPSLAVFAVLAVLAVLAVPAVLAVLAVGVRI